MSKQKNGLIAVLLVSSACIVGGVAVWATKKFPKPRKPTAEQVQRSGDAQTKPDAGTPATIKPSAVKPPTDCKNCTFDSMESGQTPLHVAAHNDCLDCCTKLIEAGADVNAPDDRGNTPAHMLMDTGKATHFLIPDEVFLDLFVDAKADFRKKNIDGERPIDPIMEELALARERLGSAGVFGYTKGTPPEEIERMKNDPDRLKRIKDAQDKVKALEKVVKALAPKG